jgi:hypothetical protein
LKLNDILELEFQMTYALNIPFNYNQMEYYEFVWRFERLVEERKKENSIDEESKGRMSISNLGANMAQMNGNTNNNDGLGNG